MGLLALLLLLNTALPQRDALGDERFRAMVAASPRARFVLETLGLGSIPTHPLFLGLLALFFVSLGCSLVDRQKPSFCLLNQ